MGRKKTNKKKRNDGTIRGHHPLGFWGFITLSIITYAIMIGISKIPSIELATRGILFNLLIGPIGIFVGIAYVIFILSSIASAFFPLNKTKIVNGTLTTIAALFFVFLLIFWMGNYPLTKTGFLLEEQHLNVLLTAVLVIATIVNISFYRKQAGINRLTTLDYHLQDDLSIKIENKDKFIAKEVIMSLYLRKRQKKETENDSINSTFRKSMFQSRDMNFGTISLRSKSKSIKKFIEHSAKITINEYQNHYGDLEVKYKPKSNSGKYILFTEIYFKSDLGESSKYSMRKYTQIELDKEGNIKVKEL